MKKLVIFPFNGNGIEALDCIDETEFDFLGFVDDDLAKRSAHYKILRRNFIEKHTDVLVLAVPGSSLSYLNRKKIISSLPVSNPKRFVSIQHPTAFVGKNVKIGVNCLIMAGVVLTSNAQIKDHVCILPNSVIHHDSIIGEYTLVGSNVVVAGGTYIGKNCYVGSGSSIMNDLSIGDGSLVGMGSNVIRNVEKRVVVAGNPARDLSFRNKTKSF
ncbi:DapH/DapD/GlmU-related protein [Salinimicrobium sp. TH3]|uniref:DapH/DapD/GlmU-related protein n=1 Tax=Salinimicrobium sp. TH3 TaxID=2997342 RepID=UPI0022722F68|nr:DapH/DapD/GlmU-related protein [Salinimicrobium sp. TH3]MCY2687957.1 DapH/DapD/GlmU-related protein [Salinimicrobium sp. TH3]